MVKLPKPQPFGEAKEAAGGAAAAAAAEDSSAFVYKCPLCDVTMDLPIGKGMLASSVSFQWCFLWAKKAISDIMVLLFVLV